jgi:thiamine kinase-like enzyme
MFRNEVLKSSVKFPSKINREREWLRLAPDFAKPFIPGLLSYAEGEYSMERIRGVNLRHLALYYDRSHSTWVDVFRQLRRFTCECHIRAERSTTDTLFWNQLLERVYERAGDNKAEARAYALKLADTLTETGFAKESSFMHGDLCFSNIIYRPGDKTVKLIDPRGDMSGHYLYDIAKLMHSVYGKYDYIDENLYVIGQDGTFFYDSEEDGMHLAFRDIIECHLSYGERKLAHVICAGLFLTMIPLHADNPEHQWLFLAEHKRLMAAL